MRYPLRNGILAALASTALVACGGGDSGPAFPDNSASPSQATAVPIPPGQIERAIGQLDQLASSLMASSGIPGMAVAVVHGGKIVYAKGYGVRAVGSPMLVDADTVFMLASMSKPVGATVVAQQVGAGRVQWDTPVQKSLPSFALADPYISQQLTIGDLYAHRSGLPDHAGDALEDIGYDRAQVLQRLRYVPLAPFRSTYAYTNFGLTAGAEAVATAAGTDWATLSEQVLYRPLRMDSTSSRFADYQTRQNRAVGHMKQNGAYLPAPVRDADAQSPAGGVTSSVNDIAKWMALLLANGAAGGQQLVPAAALLPALSPQIVSNPASSVDSRAGFYGYGFNVGTSAAGRVLLSHSGAFLLGAATAFTLIPSADVGIVVLTNSWPIGVPETLIAQFSDLVQLGSIQRDWGAFFTRGFAGFIKPEGALVGVPRPAQPAPPQALAAYTGTYQNDFYGPLQVLDKGGTLELQLGPKPEVLALTHWDGDVFTFTPSGENAPPGTISQVWFTPGQVELEYFNKWNLGVFRR